MRLVREILGMLHTKWNIRCDMMEEEGKKREEEELRERCSEKQIEISENDLLQDDQYLLHEMYSATAGMRTMTIRERERSLELAILAKEKLD